MNDEENFDLSHWTHDSVVGLEKELIIRNGKFLLRLQEDPVLYGEFREFMSLSKSLRLVILLNVALTFFFAPPIIAHAGFELPIFSFFEIFLLSITVTSGWLSCFTMCDNSPVRRYCSFLLSWTRNTSWQSLSDQLQAVLYLSLVILMSLVMIRRVMKGECQGVKVWSVWICNSSASSNVYPVDSAISLMMIPIFFCCVMREMRIVLTIVAWSMVMFTLIYCTCMLPSFMSIYALIVYGLASYAIMLDSFKQYLLLYLLSRQLKKTIEVNQQLTDQNKATEMRHMIANVAHDLKTPLSSFMTGIDLISADLADLVEKLQPRMTSPIDLGSDYLASFVSNLQSSILNIRNTNAFMLMTINRCLDYTKSSNGMKLVPKYETIELAETLTLPMFCMTNMQQKNKISLVPYDDEGICSHIITDKQWLQENVLCLLSNAVKYSAGGEVQIRVTKVKRSEKEGDESLSATPIASNLNERFRPLRFTKKKESWISLKNIFMNVAVDNPFMSVKNLRLQSRYNYYDNKVVPTNGITQDIELGNLSVSGSSKDLQTSGKASVSTPGTTRMSFHRSFLRRKSDEQSNTSENEELVFEVIDGGIGVPADAMDTLFNPFKQTQRLAGGTGLGLYSLAKRIEALKGKFGVHQRADGKQGSVFWFTIPYKADVLTAAHFMASKEDMSMRRRSLVNESFPIHAARIARNEAQLSMKANDHVTDLRILLAEDTPSIAKMMKLLLNRQRHDVTVAENGQIALDLLSEGKFDVVLMDLQMPVMDGLEATRRIRAGERSNGSGEHQIVIGVSANSDNETMEEGLRAGIDDFLPKPFSMEAFIGAIKRAEEKYGKSDEATLVN